MSLINTGERNSPMGQMQIKVHEFPLLKNRVKNLEYYPPRIENLEKRMSAYTKCLEGLSMKIVKSVSQENLVYRLKVLQSEFSNQFINYFKNLEKKNQDMLESKISIKEFHTKLSLKVEQSSFQQLSVDVTRMKDMVEHMHSCLLFADSKGKQKLGATQENIDTDTIYHMEMLEKLKSNSAEQMNLMENRLLIIEGDNCNLHEKLGEQQILIDRINNGESNFSSSSGENENENENVYSKFEYPSDELAHIPANIYSPESEQAKLDERIITTDNPREEMQVTQELHSPKHYDTKLSKFNEVELNLESLRPKGEYSDISQSISPSPKTVNHEIVLDLAKRSPSPTSKHHHSKISKMMSFTQTNFAKMTSRFSNVDRICEANNQRYDDLKMEVGAKRMAFENKVKQELEELELKIQEAQIGRSNQHIRHEQIVAHFAKNNEMMNDLERKMRRISDITKESISSNLKKITDMENNVNSAITHLQAFNKWKTSLNTSITKVEKNAKASYHELGNKLNIFMKVITDQSESKNTHINLQINKNQEEIESILNKYKAEMESMMNELNRTKKIDRQMVSDYMEMVKVFENQIKTEEFNKTISTSTTPQNMQFHDTAVKEVSEAESPIKTLKYKINKSKAQNTLDIPIVKLDSQRLASNTKQRNNKRSMSISRELMNTSRVEHHNSNTGGKLMQFVGGVSPRATSVGRDNKRVHTRGNYSSGAVSRGATPGRSISSRRGQGVGVVRKWTSGLIININNIHNNTHGDGFCMNQTLPLTLTSVSPMGFTPHNNIHPAISTVHPGDHGGTHNTTISTTNNMPKYNYNYSPRSPPEMESSNQRPATHQNAHARKNIRVDIAQASKNVNITSPISITQPKTSKEIGLNRFHRLMRGGEADPNITNSMMPKYE